VRNGRSDGKRKASGAPANRSFESTLKLKIMQDR
jgi:hypothetical protein